MTIPLLFLPAPPQETAMTAPDTDTLAGLLAAATPGPWKAFIDDSGGQWSGWPLSVEAISITDKTVVRTGGQWPYEWDAKTSQYEAVANARLIALAPELAAETIALRAQSAKDKARIEKYAAALRFYGDISDYHAPLTGGLGKLYFDCGQVARAALEGGE